MIAVFDSVEGYQDNILFVLFDNGEVDSFSFTNCLIPGRPWEITRIWRVASTLDVRDNNSLSGRRSTDRDNSSVSSYILWLHNRPVHGMSWGYNDEGTLKRYQWFFQGYLWRTTHPFIPITGILDVRRKWRGFLWTCDLNNCLDWFRNRSNYLQHQCMRHTNCALVTSTID